MGLGEGIEASAGTPSVATKVKAMASATISAPSKKPSMGIPIAARTSLLVGQYTEGGSGST